MSVDVAGIEKYLDRISEAINKQTAVLRQICSVLNDAQNNPVVSKIKHEDICPQCRKQFEISDTLLAIRPKNADSVIPDNMCIDCTCKALDSRSPIVKIKQQV